MPYASLAGSGGRDPKVKHFYLPPRIYRTEKVAHERGEDLGADLYIGRIGEHDTEIELSAVVPEVGHAPEDLDFTFRCDCNGGASTISFEGCDLHPLGHTGVSIYRPFDPSLIVKR